MLLAFAAGSAVIARLTSGAGATKQKGRLGGRPEVVLLREGRTPDEMSIRRHYRALPAGDK
ncbi:hypothetical protein DF3PA_160024 [Candidatus Defluviicoccus seviourii]|uniref:Uncharacterized protein n=2 Tax=root TaxID=1 RepID=A0A564WCZ1_9PROT|nr:hypothetical protein DF3PB_1460002 [uncultured Defluviicoccus sp.]VUX45838.1 hypothetical protein DF3PA_160024 [Candidatus Defluviicoccus seviourii]